MSTYESIVAVGIRTHCDRKGCNTEVYRDFYGPNDPIPRTAVEGRNHVNRNRLKTEHAKALISQGWTYWVGSRGSFMMCPEHKPSPTSVKMVRHDEGHPKVGAACFHEKHDKCPGPNTRFRSQRVWCECDCHDSEME